MTASPDKIMSQYEALLKTTRLRTTDVPGRNIVAESESDRGRVLFCAAFRRLQQKAQVFSMEPNAAVRSRLTHSLEVSQLGRYIADQVCEKLTDLGAIEPQERIAFVNFVETACLMHDIGNPPFGHFGEAAIKKWFADNGEACIKDAIHLSRGQLGSGDLRAIDALADFGEFDGNPQGLRIVTRLQWNADEFGLNLTKTALASFLKYIRRAGTSGSARFHKKAGYFRSEESIVTSVWSEFQYASPQRFPLAYVMEAADDIAYCVSDLEDSVEKGLVQQLPAMEEIQRLFRQQQFPSDDAEAIKIEAALRDVIRGSREDGKEYTYTDFRTSLNRTIVGFAADQYVSRHEEVLRGEVDGLLPVNTPCGAILDALRTFCRKNVYNHVSIQRTEYAGYTAIKGLLDHLKPLLACSSARFGAALAGENKDGAGLPIIIESKLLSLFPEKYKKVYEHSTKDLPEADDAKFAEWNARAHLVVDYVAGMTDDFAMTTYRTLSGMRL